jgi:MFS family permease
VILRRADLLALTAAETISGVGSRMTYLALPWFVLVTTGSPTKMGLVLAAELLPMAVLGIPSGTLVQRLGARTTMLASDVVRVPLMASLPVLHDAGVLSFPLLLVLVAAFGCFWAPYFSAQRVILPELLGDEEKTIAQANSVIDGATNASGLLGPPIAGVLIAWMGAANVLYVDAATFLVSFLLVAVFVPRRARPVATEDAGDVLAGLRFFARDAVMGRFIGVIVLFNGFGQMLAASLPVLAFQRFGDPHVGGWLFGAYGVGGLVGTIIAFQLVTRVGPYKLAAAAVVGIALPLWLLTFDLPLGVILAALTVSALCSPLVNAPMFGVITTRTPKAILPKVMTAIITLATLAGPIGLVAVGPLIEHTSLTWAFALVAAGSTLAAAMFVHAIVRAQRAVTWQAFDPALATESVP